MAEGTHISTKTLTVADEAKIETVTVKKAITVESDDTVNIGTSTKQLKNAYFDGTVYADDLDLDAGITGTGTPTGQTKYLKIKIDGTTKYILLYDTPP